MAAYYDTDPDDKGDHEVHRAGALGCLPQNRIYLGDFASCEPAVLEAKKHYAKVDGCWF